MSRKFTVEMVLERVTTSEREANRILATYGDGDSQVRQMAEWRSQGWKFDEAKKEWYFLHPVPQVCVDGKAISRKLEIQDGEKDAITTAVSDLFMKVQDSVDVVETACMLSAGYQYKTRPNFKAKSTKGEAERIAQIRTEFIKANATDPAEMGLYVAALNRNEEAKFLREWDAEAE